MQEGKMKVEIKDDRGFLLSKEYGFTVQEESRVLAFDLYDNPDIGPMLLFGDQVCALRFWRDEDLENGRRVVNAAIDMELRKRRDASK